MSDDVDVVILGAGPAGLAAGFRCGSLGMSAVVLDACASPGGQLHRIPYAVENLPGHAPVACEDLLARLVAQCRDVAVPVLTDHRAALDASTLVVRCDARRAHWRPRAVVVATGVRRRALDVPGERELTGRGVFDHHGRDLARFRGARVVIVGGGDDAFEHARILRPYAQEVTLVHRSDRYSARPAMRAPVESDRGVTLRPFTRVLAVEGDGRVEALRVETPRGEARIECDAVLVCVGPQPVTEGLGLATDPRGYLVVDHELRTSAPGVFAVGDVCAPDAPTLAGAFGHGATVAKVILAARGRPVATAVAPAASEPRASDLLAVRDLMLPARIGVYPRERSRRQMLGFEVRFDIDASRAAPTDTVRDTVDYAAAVECIAAVLASQHFNLIETVAAVVAEALLQRFATPRVHVRVTKPGVPQRHAAASVEVERRRRG